MAKFSVLTVAALTWLLAFSVGDASIDGLLEDDDGYRAYPSQEIYRPLPSTTVHNVTSHQCARNCSEQAEPDCKHFEHCARQGIESGVCRLYAGSNIRLRTRPSDDCTIYTKDDPAKHGIPHGAELHDGTSSHMRGPILLQTLLPITVATVTLRRTLV